MSTPSNHFKLGLFVLLALGASLGAAVALGAARAARKTVSYHVFFNESVQGLDVGSPVRYRGVSIGAVASIEIAPDHRHVDVVAELDVGDIRRMGLTEGGPQGRASGRFIIPPELRAPLGSQGITSVKYISIDFFSEEDNPAPDLPFSTPENNIPAAPSLMKNIEDSLMAVADKLLSTLTRMDTILEDIQKQKVSEKAVATLDNVGEAVADLRRILAQVERAGLPAKAGATIDEVRGAVVLLSGVLDKVNGDRGLLASVQQATDAIGKFSRSATGQTTGLADTLRDLGEAARAIRDLADTLERDPDMLLKGRSKVKAP